MTYHCVSGAFFALALALSPVALAQSGAREFPGRPVRVVVPQATGGATDIQARLFAAKIRAQYVPYRSVGTAMLDLVGGRLDATFANVLSAGHYVRSGKLRALGISTSQRSRAFPELPTLAEQGASGSNASTFHGYAVPARTPAAIVEKLAAEFGRIVRSAEVRDQFLADGAEPIGSTPQAFGRFIAAEVKVWHEVVRESGVNIEARR